MPTDTEGNAIAYNQDIREQLESLHELLGDEVSSIISRAVEPAARFSAEAERAMQAMSEGASKLTLVLLNARQSKKKLNAEEVRDAALIKEAAGALGNLQLKLNKVLKLSKQINGLNLELKRTAIALTDDIMTSQRVFREVRAGINDLGVLSNDPTLAYNLRHPNGDAA